MNRTVRDLISSGRVSQFGFVKPDASVLWALQVLKATDTGAVLVVDGTDLRGIFSERDLARAATRAGPLNLDLAVDRLMTKDLVTVDPGQTLEQCMLLMSKYHVRHLPVVENGAPVGLLSMRHIMEALVEDKQFMIEEMTKYLMGSNYA
ncbi:MAG: CBS domain-containing protein [Bdellovibrionales bacterium]